MDMQREWGPPPEEVEYRYIASVLETEQQYPQAGHQPI